MTSNYDDDDDAARAAAFADDSDDDQGPAGGGGGGGGDDNDDNEQQQQQEEEEFAASPTGLDTSPTGLDASPTDAADNDVEAGEEGGGGDDGDGDGGGGEWQAFQDDEGRTYYYNAATEESSWEVPEGYVAPPPAPAEDGAEAATTGGGAEGGSAEEEVPAPDEAAAAGGAAAAAEGGGEEDEQRQGEQHQEQEQEQQRWTAYKDDEGRTYFYNDASGETQWDRPEGPNVTVVEEEEVVAEEAGAAEAEGGAEPAEAMEEGEAPAEVEGEAGEEGEVGTAREQPQPSSPSGAAPMDVDRAEEGPVTAEEAPAAAEEEKKEKEPERDPKEVALEKAEAALREPDAVLEPGCLDSVAELVNQLGGSIGGPRAMQSLVASYHGQTAVCGLLGLWLADLRTASGGGGGPSTAAAAGGKASAVPSPASASAASAPSALLSTQDAFADSAEYVRSIAEGVVNRMAKERFTRAGGDGILSLSRKEVAFLEEMMDSDRWRGLLIDLSASHKDSALLMYCLQSISKRGHHREIAKRINQSDYFGVFNAMLTSELTFIGKVAVGGGGGGGDDAAADATLAGIDGLVADLRRTCTATSYTYLYAMEVLHELNTRAKAKAFADPTQASEIRQAMRKWDRLREEIEEAMMGPNASGGQSSAGVSPLVRKRRLDIALTVSELHQRQRRRVEPSSGNKQPAMDGNGTAAVGAAPTMNGNNSLRDTLDTAVMKLIRKYSSGLAMDNEMAEQLLRGSYGTSKLMVGEILIAHTSALSALMAYLFKPGSTRIRSLEMRHKCAKLVALAALASEAALSGNADGGPSDTKESESRMDEDALTKIILKGSQLCEQVENMVTFTAVDSIEDTKASSVGRQLSSLCIKHAPVAQGVLLWATELGNGPDFCESAAYPTLAPSILSLARIISIHHPFSRLSVQDLAFIFLKHSPPELSFQKVQALKEQCVRLLLWLTTQGQAVRVFSAISDKMRLSGSSAGIDPALLRYFVAGSLQIIRPPISVQLIRSLGAMLSSKTCVDALRSSNFDVTNKKMLAELMSYFKEAVSDETKLNPRASSGDKALVSSLVSVYC